MDSEEEGFKGFSSEEVGVITEFPVKDFPSLCRRKVGEVPRRSVMLVCEECETFFESDDKYMSHVTRHHGKKESCGVCGKTMDPTTLRTHILRVHCRANDVECRKCHKRLCDKRQLKIHNCEKRPWLCDVCNTNFMTKNNVTQHILAVHLGKIKNNQCFICKKTLCRTGEIMKHIRLEHKTDVEEMVDGKEDEKEEMERGKVEEMVDGKDDEKEEPEIGIDVVEDGKENEKEEDDEIEIIDWEDEIEEKKMKEKKDEVGKEDEKEVEEQEDYVELEIEDWEDGIDENERETGIGTGKNEGDEEQEDDGDIEVVEFSEERMLEHDMALSQLEKMKKKPKTELAPSKKKHFCAPCGEWFVNRFSLNRHNSRFHCN